MPILRLYDYKMCTVGLLSQSISSLSRETTFGQFTDHKFKEESDMGDKAVSSSGKKKEKKRKNKRR